MKFELKNITLLYSFLIVSIFVYLSLSIICVFEFYNVAILKNTENYPFGGEGPVANCYYYKTAELYATHNLVCGLVFTSSLVFNIYATIIEKWRVLAFLITLFVFLLLILQGLFTYFYS